MAETREQAKPDARNRPEVVLVSAMRNEGPFILEWLAYHRVIGIDRVVIVSNGSTDGSDDLLAALDAAGEITFLPTAPGPDQSPLEAGLLAFESKVGYRDGNWYTWLDADEFLNIHVGGRRIPDLLDALGATQGIMLNWRIFGTSGHDTFPGRFISTDFTRASRENFVANLETKTLFRKSATVVGFAKIGQERPLLAKGHGLRPQDFLGGNGKPLLADEPRNLAWLAHKPQGRTNLAARKEAGHALAQINHYAVRTPEFFRLKQVRGRGYTKSGGGGRARYTVSYFSRFDQNETEDRSILHWEADVTAEIDRLLALPGVAAAQVKVDRRVTKALRQADATMSGTMGPLASAFAAVDLGEDAGDDGDEGDEAQSFELTFDPTVRRLVETYYKAASVILEYGSGGSTVLGARLGHRVFSVESDQDWAARLAEHVADLSDKVHLHHVDIGPTGAWGAPTKAREYRKFPQYALSVWDRPDFQDPDLVLIDGRFRASCMVAVLMRTKKPVTVLFDDYANRAYYHGVERLARKEELVGRMARFTVTPGAIPADMVTQAIGWFTDPR